MGEERQTGEVGFGKEKRDKIVRKLGVAKVNIWCCRQKKLLRFINILAILCIECIEGVSKKTDKR